MNRHILHVTCLTDNFPDGQKITGARLQYDRPIDGRWITPAAFWVKDHRITGIAVDGDMVALSFDVTQPAASIIPAAGPRRDGSKPPVGAPKGPKPGAGGPPRDMPSAARMPREVEVAQVSDIKAMDGTILPADEESVFSDEAYEPIICEIVFSRPPGICLEI